MTRFLIGLDDTDMPGTPGTNQLARRIAETLPPGFSFDVVLRHQLLFDPRIPYTSHNGCASIGVRAQPGHGIAELLEPLRRRVRAFSPPGSDPGLCVLDSTVRTPQSSWFGDLRAFGERCQREPVEQADALDLARKHGAHLEPLGGTGDGIIGALAAVGLRTGGNDGRVVHRAGWPWPDAFAGQQTVKAILARGVDEIREPDGHPVEAGLVDVGKHLRPAFRGDRVVLVVEPETTPRASEQPIASKHPPTQWTALKLP